MRCFPSPEGRKNNDFRIGRGSFKQRYKVFICSVPLIVRIYVGVKISVCSEHYKHCVRIAYPVFQIAVPFKSGKRVNGIVAAVADFGSMPISNGQMSGYLLKQVDGGYYMAYNIAVVTAEKIRLLTGNQYLQNA